MTHTDLDKRQRENEKMNEQPPQTDINFSKWLQANGWQEVKDSPAHYQREKNDRYELALEENLLLEYMDWCAVHFPEDQWRADFRAWYLAQNFQRRGME